MESIQLTNIFNYFNPAFKQFTVDFGQLQVTATKKISEGAFAYVYECETK